MIKNNLIMRETNKLVQSLSHVQFSVTPWTAARQGSLSITNFQNPTKPMSNGPEIYLMY